MDTPTPFTQADLERVRAAAVKLAMDAPALVGDHPLFAVAALSLALAQVAIFTDTAWETLLTLLGCHYEDALATEMARVVRAAGGVVTQVPKPELKS